MKRRATVILLAGLIAGCAGLFLAQSANADTYMTITRTSMPATTYFEPAPCFEERVISSPVLVEPSTTYEERVISSPVLVEPSTTYVEPYSTFDERVIESPVIVKEKPNHLLHLRAPLVRLNIL